MLSIDSMPTANFLQNPIDFLSPNDIQRQRSATLLPSNLFQNFQVPNISFLNTLISPNVTDLSPNIDVKSNTKIDNNNNNIEKSSSN